ncbi:pyridoxal phosphate-dependent decarboxylase family protein [Nakamurella lactea]|uniref:pyridoxal phosphate-dependent decarboxylase family protein n=1 Tax=Nakamurella lactea TaxID=459515 RepID=UPI001B7FEB0B|nr:pyridoxal-dependent decarboxylase [Nakamurella lactea]
MSHMSADEFRRNGHQVIDWIADYWESIDHRPVLAQVNPGEIAAKLPHHAPEHPEPFDAVLADLDEIVMPGITHWQHPRFFAYFPANSSPAAALGDLLSSGIGAQGMIWATSPALTELEQVVMDAFAEALGLPEAFRHNGSDGVGGGVIADTASTATFTALLAALHRSSGGRARVDGVATDRYTIYGSSQAHSSLLKASMMAGLGEQAIRSIDVDPATQAMDLDSLRAAVERDVAQGFRPVMIQAAVGTTSTGAVDPVALIGPVAREVGAWLHVDAAWAGVAAVRPELRWINDGVAEYADSYVTNPHKWLLTTFDCSTFWVRDRQALTGALSLLPEYLRNPASESGAVVDFRDWHPQLGRRFRAVKLWMVLRSYGLTGLRRHIGAGIAQARRIADLVLDDPRMAFAAPPVLGLVTFRIVADDNGTRLTDEQADLVTMTAMELVNASGVAYLSHTKVNDRTAIRIAVGGWRTTDADIETTWEQLRQAAASALATAPPTTEQPAG